MYRILCIMLFMMCSCGSTKQDGWLVDWSAEEHPAILAGRDTASPSLFQGVADTFTIDGISAVRIDGTVWARRNLNTSQYCNGDTIPEIRETKKWRKARSGAWSYYENDPEYGKKYGKLYNWYAVNDPRGLCPCGWTVASDRDWQSLVAYFGGKFESIRYLLHSSDWPTDPWRKDNSGFDALSGGFRPTPEGSHDGSDFDGLSGGVWWASTPDLWRFVAVPNGTAWGMDLGNSYAYRANNGTFVGKSVRCVQKAQKRS